MTVYKTPSLEEAVDAARPLEMVRRHVSGFGSLYITKPKDAEGNRVLKVHLYLGRHDRLVNRELLAMIQPAADVLTRALQANRCLFLDTNARPFVLKMKAN